MSECIHAYIGVVLLQQLRDGLQQRDQELSGLPQDPAGLGDEDTQEDPAHLQLPLSRPVCNRELLRQLRAEVRGRGIQRGFLINTHSMSIVHIHVLYIYVIVQLTLQLTSGLSFCCLK